MSRRQWCRAGTTVVRRVRGSRQPPPRPGNRQLGVAACLHDPRETGARWPIAPRASSGRAGRRTGRRRFVPRRAPSVRPRCRSLAEFRRAPAPRSRGPAARRPRACRRSSRARARDDESRPMPHHRLAGPVVESDLGEGEIVVADQQQIRDRLAHQVGYLGALTGDVELDATPDEAIRGVVVEPHRYPMVAQGRVLLAGLLQHRHRGVCVVNGLDLRAEGVDTCRLQPLAFPGGQVPAAGLPAARTGPAACCPMRARRNMRERRRGTPRARPRPPAV